MMLSVAGVKCRFWVLDVVVGFAVECWGGRLLLLLLSVVGFAFGCLCSCPLAMLSFNRLVDGVAVEFCCSCPLHDGSDFCLRARSSDTHKIPPAGNKTMKILTITTQSNPRDSINNVYFSQSYTLSTAVTL